MEPTGPGSADPAVGRLDRTRQHRRLGRTLYQDEDASIVAKVLEIAGRRGVSAAQVALAWVMAQPAITSQIVGVTRPEHLKDAVAAVDLELSTEQLDELSAGYVPHRSPVTPEAGLPVGCCR